MEKRLIIFAALLLFAGCEREITDPAINPITPDVPSMPFNLNITVADTELELTWDVLDSTSIVGYRIYYSDFLNGNYTLLDNSETRMYTMGNLQNGTYYFFKVSAVNTNGVEGRLSNAAYGTPNLYSIIIDNGQERTADRHVTLTFIAPENTALMLIANDSNFTESSWEPFIDSRSWLLTGGNGEKTVSAVFRDADGNMTRDTASDNITFEVPAYAYSIIVNDDAEFAYSRDVDLVINAPESTSYMMISNLTDFSDAGWQSYSEMISWHISSDIASNRDEVGFYALFRDSNDDSVAIQAADSIILASADPVDINPVFQPEDSYQNVTLSWTPSMSGDFSAYRLFRSRGSTSVDTLITSLFDIGQTIYIDNLNITDLPDNTPESINYMVRFYSVYDDSADSDIIEVTLINNEPPVLSTFISDINYDIDTLAGSDMQAVFGWQRSGIIDFGSYVIYENIALDTSSADIVFYSYEQNNLTYDIVKNNVDTLTVYYYWLKVFDLGGQSSGFSEPDSVYY